MQYISEDNRVSILSLLSIRDFLCLQLSSRAVKYAFTTPRCVAVIKGLLSLPRPRVIELSLNTIAQHLAEKGEPTRYKRVAECYLEALENAGDNTQDLHLVSSRVCLCRLPCFYGEHPEQLGNLFHDVSIQHSLVVGDRVRLTDDCPTLEMIVEATHPNWLLSYQNNDEKLHYFRDLEWLSLPYKWIECDVARYAGDSLKVTLNLVNCQWYNNRLNKPRWVSHYYRSDGYVSCEALVTFRYREVDYSFTKGYTADRALTATEIRDDILTGGTTRIKSDAEGRACSTHKG